MKCHGEPDLTKDLDGGVVKSMYIDAEMYANSIHGPIGCTACHAEISELPHEPDLKPVDCGVCHGQAMVYADSLHGKRLASGDKDVAACQDCHGKHDIRSVADPLSPTTPRNLPQTCGRCHSDRNLVKKHMVSLLDPTGNYLKSAHAHAIFDDNNQAAATCSSCHGVHDLLPAHDPRSKVYRSNIAATCGACHPKIQQEFAESIHGQALEAGIPDAPTCTDCHGEHDIEPSGWETSAVNYRQISRSTCPRCHDSERVMTRYGVATMRQASYMDSYHGMASVAGSTVVASCASCHTAHDIRPASDPTSSTHPANLPATCGKCHEGAGPNFASGAVHIIPTHPDQRALGIVRIVYIWAIILIIGSMVIHNSLLMVRHSLGKFRRELSGPHTYRRFTRGQTIGHFILTVSFIALVISGFALRYPESWWSRVLFFDGAGLGFRDLIHRVAGVLLIAVTIVNLVYLAAGRAGRQEFWSLMLNWRDAKDIAKNMAYAVGLSKEKPQFDRYSYSEKFEYWGMWWGTIIMIVTGLVMWFAADVMYYFPKLVVDVAALIHFYEAWLATATIVIWHFYYMVFDPDTYPMNWSWITGKITEEDFKERHPLEYERLVAAKAASSVENVPSGSQDKAAAAGTVQDK